jgi:hypothetical protein
MEKIILFDNPRHGWSHLVASDLETLHAFAQSIGLKKHWFQNKKKEGKKQPHYDLKITMFDTAIAHGAKRVTRAELLTFLENTYY